MEPIFYVASYTGQGDKLDVNKIQLREIKKQEASKLMLSRILSEKINGQRVMIFSQDLKEKFSGDADQDEIMQKVKLLAEQNLKVGSQETKAKAASVQSEVKQAKETEVDFVKLFAKLDPKIPTTIAIHLYNLENNKQSNLDFMFKNPSPDLQKILNEIEKAHKEGRLEKLQQLFKSKELIPELNVGGEQKFLTNSEVKDLFNFTSSPIDNRTRTMIAGYLSSLIHGVKGFGSAADSWFGNKREYPVQRIVDEIEKYKKSGNPDDLMGFRDFLEKENLIPKLNEERRYEIGEQRR